MLRTAFKSLTVLAVVGFILVPQQAQAGPWHRGSWRSSGGYPVMDLDSTDRPETIPPAPEVPAPPALTLAAHHPTQGPLRNNAYLSVKVPADAKVFVNDRPTPSIGTDRKYISRDLRSGAHYNYAVRAIFVRNGQTVSQTKRAQLTAGQSANFDFTQDEMSVQTAANPETGTISLARVPADAKSYLSDQKMKAHGRLRELSTAELPGGSPCPNYPIRAALEKDGRRLSSADRAVIESVILARRSERNLPLAIISIESSQSSEALATIYYACEIPHQEFIALKKNNGAWTIVYATE